MIEDVILKYYYVGFLLLIMLFTGFFIRNKRKLKALRGSGRIVEIISCENYVQVSLFSMCSVAIIYMLIVLSNI